MGTMRILVFACVFGFGSILAEPDRDCNQIQRFVADYVRFLNQMPQETYPVNNFCSSHNTTKHYHDAVEWFESAKGNESCAADFNQNRLNVIQTLYDQMTSIWEAAHCEDCVSNSNETAHFMKLYESQYNCTKKHHENPCEVCAKNYTVMQHFYEDLVHSRKGVVCFDIEDRMNQTRYAWSAKFNCCKGKQHSQEAFIWFASSISSLPVIFYLAMFFFTRRKEARERAMAPPLNDKAVGEQQPEEEPPQPSTSQVAQKQSSKATDDDDDDDQCIADADAKEPKINNLNIVPGVRESRLIDLNDSGSENLQSEQDSKLPPVKGDVDDVSLLGARDLLH